MAHEAGGPPPHSPISWIEQRRVSFCRFRHAGPCRAFRCTAERRYVETGPQEEGAIIALTGRSRWRHLLWGRSNEHSCGSRLSIHLGSQDFLPSFPDPLRAHQRETRFPPGRPSSRPRCQNSARAQGFANAAPTRAPLLAPRRSGPLDLATGGSGGNLFGLL